MSVMPLLMFPCVFKYNKCKPVLHHFLIAGIVVKFLDILSDHFVSAFIVIGNINCHPAIVLGIFVFIHNICF